MTQHAALLKVCRRDPRFAYEAYEYLFAAMSHAQKLLGRLPTDTPGSEHHVTGPELIHGMISLARQDFGLMAGVVFKIWGVHKSEDVGELVFNLIDANIFSKTDSDSKDDFRDVCDFDEVFSHYEITVGTAD